jgi:single-strand DNA-binding protein
MNVNKAIIVGRITRDPDVRTTTSGQTVTSIGIATNRYWTDKNGQKQEKTDFHNVIFWSRLAEIAGQYLQKGQEVYVEGRIETRTYTGKDGVERRVTEIIGENMQMGSRPQGSRGPESAAPAKKTPEEDIPTINLDEEKNEVKIEDVPF